jgi:6-phosphogluconolactonase (cycloisomerase 2 family)
MRISHGRRIAVAACSAAAAATCLFAAPGSAATTPRATLSDGARVVFVLTDDPSGNQVVAYDRGQDGKLTFQASYPTGGDGGVLDGSVVDHTASQGALAYDAAHSLLYAVNAGSNSVSVFRVDGDTLQLRQTVASGGKFPVSVAFFGQHVYVLNARNGGSIQGYIVAARKLHLIPPWHRGLHSDTSTAPEFTHTPGQVAFSPSGRQLIVTTKAGSNAVLVYRMHGFGGPSRHPVVNSQPDAVPFAVAFDPQGHLAVVQAGTNAVATFTLSSDGTLDPLASVPTGQQASCWVVRDAGYLFVSNAGSATLSRFQTHADGDLSLLGNTGTDPGTVDAAVSADGSYLYVQTGGQGIVDEFAVHADGSLAQIGSVTVPDAVGGEGIVAF